MTRVGLVLGGGGIAGFAYLTTALTVLQQITGWDPRSAEVIVGTSAGANAAGLLRGGIPVGQSLDDVMTLPANPRTMGRLRQLSGREQDRSPRVLPAALGLAAREAMRGPMARPGRIVTGLAPRGQIRTDTLGDRMIELHGEEWPDRELLVTAVRLDDGERVVFGGDRTDIDVGNAVEASSAIPGFFRPVRIEGYRYVDGGVHSPTNADLLIDRPLDLVVVVAPMSVDSWSTAWMTTNGALRMFWKRQVQNDVARLREAGHEVLLLEPSIEEARAMGPTMMDPTRMLNVVLQTSSAARSAMTEARLGSELDILRMAARGNGTDLERGDS